MNIVVVDDNKDICALLETALKSKGHEVTIYSDPTEVPFFSRQQCPCEPTDRCADALIADIVMPHVEGVEFIKKIKELGCWTLAIGNVAIMSGYLTLHYMNDLHDLDVQYFRKPFELKDIYMWLDECERRLAKATEESQAEK